MSKVSQFGATLLAAWQKAIKGELRVNCGPGEEGRKKSVHLRYRLYMLRAAMRKENHPDSPGAERVKLILDRDSKGNHFVVSLIADQNFDDILREAGVEIPSAPDLDFVEVETEGKKEEANGK